MQPPNRLPVWTPISGPALQPTASGGSCNAPPAAVPAEPVVGNRAATPPPPPPPTEPVVSTSLSLSPSAVSQSELLQQEISLQSVWTNSTSPPRAVQTAVDAVALPQASVVARPRPSLGTANRQVAGYPLAQQPIYRDMYGRHQSTSSTAVPMTASVLSRPLSVAAPIHRTVTPDRLRAVHTMPTIVTTERPARSVSPVVVVRSPTPPSTGRVVSPARTVMSPPVVAVDPFGRPLSPVRMVASPSVASIDQSSCRTVMSPSRPLLSPSLSPPHSKTWRLSAPAPAVLSLGSPVSPPSFELQSEPPPGDAACRLEPDLQEVAPKRRLLPAANPAGMSNGGSMHLAFEVIKSPDNGAAPILGTEYAEPIVRQHVPHARLTEAAGNEEQWALQSLQLRLLSAEAAEEKERQLRSQAEKGQAQTEAELELLEQTSRTMLTDCKALRKKVMYLQMQRENLLDEQAESAEERRALQERLEMLEQIRQHGNFHEAETDSPLDAPAWSADSRRSSQASTESAVNTPEQPVIPLVAEPQRAEEETALKIDLLQLDVQQQPKVPELPAVVTPSPWREGRRVQFADEVRGNASPSREGSSCSSTETDPSGTRFAAASVGPQLSHLASEFEANSNERELSSSRSTKRTSLASGPEADPEDHLQTSGESVPASTADCEAAADACQQTHSRSVGTQRSSLALLSEAGADACQQTQTRSVGTQRSSLLSRSEAGGSSDGSSPQTHSFGTQRASLALAFEVAEDSTQRSSPCGERPTNASPAGSQAAEDRADTSLGLSPLELAPPQRASSIGGGGRLSLHNDLRRSFNGCLPEVDQPTDSRAATAIEAELTALRQEVNALRHAREEDEDRHRQAVQELHSELGMAKAAHEESAQLHAVLQGELSMLEVHVSDMRTARDRQLQQHAMLRTKLTEHEVMLADAHKMKDHHAKLHLATAGRAGDLETRLAEATIAVGDHARKREQLNAHCVELEAELAKAAHYASEQSRALDEERTRTAEAKEQLQQTIRQKALLAEEHAAAQSSADVAQAQLEEIQVARRSQLKDHGEHAHRLVDLEQKLEDAVLQKEQAGKQLSAAKSKIADLETRVQEAETDVSNMKSSHGRITTSLHSAVAELEQQLQDALNGREQQSKASSRLQTQIADLEEQLGNAITERQKQNKETKAWKAKAEELEQELADAQDAKQRHAKRSSMQLQSRISDLEDQVATLEHEKERWVTKQAEGASRVLQLEQELEQYRDNERQTKQHENKVRDLEVKLRDALRDKDTLLREAEERVATQFRTRIAELETALAEASMMQPGDGAARDGTELRSTLDRREENERQQLALKVKELEVALDIARQSRADVEGASKKRIKDLEQRLWRAEQQSAGAQDAEEMSGALENLKEQLARVTKERDRLARVQLDDEQQARTLRHRIKELEEELVKARQEKEPPGMAHMSGPLESLKEQLARVTKERDRLVRVQLDDEQAGSLRQRVQELEDRLAKAQKEKEALDESYASQLQAAEERLETATREKEKVRANYMAVTTRGQPRPEPASPPPETREGSKEGSGVQARVRELERSLENALLRENEERHRAEDIQRHAESALKKADETKKRLEKEIFVREQYHQEEMRRRSASTGAALGGVSKFRSAVSATLMTRRTQALLTPPGTSAGAVPPRSSAGAANLPGRGIHFADQTDTTISEDGLSPSLEEAFSEDDYRMRSPKHMNCEGLTRGRANTIRGLEGENKTFVDRAFEAKEVAEEALETAREGHMRLLRAEVQALGGANGDAKALRSVVFSFDQQRQDFLFQRNAKVKQLESAMRNLQAVLEEVKVKDLKLDENACEEISDMAREQLTLCLEELAIFRLHTAVGDLPDSILESLADIPRAGLAGTVSDSWEGGFLPMHWSAQHGRRDLLDFLTEQEGGRGIVLMRDARGRTPLYYAEREKKFALAEHLRQDLDGGTIDQCLVPISMRPEDVERCFRKDEEMRSLEHVETHGWHSAAGEWKNGYTLLHHAASEGRADICEYLVTVLDANPGVADESGKTPADYALAAGHRDVWRSMQELSSAQQSGKKQDRRSSVGSSGSGSRSRLARDRRAEDAKSLSPPDSRRHSQDAKSLSPPDSRRPSQVCTPPPDGASKPVPRGYWKVMEQIDRLGWEKMSWSHGFTLLHWAAKHNVPELCERFLRQGADPRQKDEEGKDALEYAKSSGSQRALLVLETPQPKHTRLVGVREAGLEHLFQPPSDRRLKPPHMDRVPSDDDLSVLGRPSAAETREAAD
eukprot:TRINITY_DN19005_c0_g1_i1.p1 TRINITY_DN19005_c0_g1~~TRINITY_DN19005_c0_g1_i1.p1  ORF type:complete len:2262 (+),score=559.31 TRINITY_DN19005_c0_g1_i1:162-6947(+)